MSRNPRGKGVAYYCDKSKFAEDTKCPIGERFMEKDLEKVVTDNFISMLNLIVDYEKKLKDVVSKAKGTEANLKQSILRLEKRVSNKTVRQK